MAARLENLSVSGLTRPETLVVQKKSSLQVKQF